MTKAKTTKKSSPKIAPKTKPFDLKRSVTDTEKCAVATAISVEDSDAAVLATFLSMIERQEYVLNHFWFAEMNRVRKENNWAPIQKREEYKFLRRGQKLFVNGVEIFDFTGKSNLALALAPQRIADLADASASFAFAFAFTLALQNNGLEKLNKTTSCEGKVVEIDGKKYKLTQV